MPHYLGYCIIQKVSYNRLFYNQVENTYKTRGHTLLSDDFEFLTYSELLVRVRVILEVSFEGVEVFFTLGCFTVIIGLKISTKQGVTQNFLMILNFELILS